ncbi:hypothetical protein [Mammaliicoccus sciuri]|uniref:hypothetical protein n=1 Tax=Mammaliicoccus sciuri TaxID=1296 RepID=UPI0034DDC122
MNNIKFNFDDNAVNFDCLECKAACCHVGNRLLMNSTQKDIILQENYLLDDFISKDKKSDTYALDVGKRCWFLDDKLLCSLHRDYGEKNKPMSCLIYPFKIWKICDHKYCVDYIPCPNFKIDYSRGVKHSQLLPSIKEYISLLDLKVNPYIIDKDISFYDSNLDKYRIYVNSHLKKKLDYKYYNKIDKITFFYQQILFNPIAISFFTTHSNMADIFIEASLKILGSNHQDFNFQNEYLLLMKHFNRLLIEYSDKGGEHNE